MKKIVSFKNIKEMLPKITTKKSVLVGGCFDLLHYGHLTFLRNAKKIGNFLLVALESDEFIKKYKKRDPIHLQDQRAEILASISYVDVVVKLPLFKSDKEYFNLVKMIKPSVIAVTEGDKQIENKKKQARLVGAKIRVASSLVKNLSSQEIIKKFL